MEQNTIQFRFYEELNNFLPPERRKVWFEHRFFGRPTVGDLIESLGVPHTGVDLILVNGESVDFFYCVKHGDRISVYPVFESLDISSITHLRAQSLREPKFIIEASLGKLAKYLRLLGFDTLYRTDYSFSSVIEIAKKDKRIVLTREEGKLSKGKMITHGYRIKAMDPKKQTEEIIVKFDLFSKINPFSICLECNVKIIAVEKNKIVNRLPLNIGRHFNEFCICPKCKRIYWPGSHYRTMSEFIRQIRKRESEDVET